MPICPSPSFRWPPAQLTPTCTTPRRDLSSQVALFRQSHEVAGRQMSELQALIAEMKHKYKAKGDAAAAAPVVSGPVPAASAAPNSQLTSESPVVELAAAPLAEPAAAAPILEGAAPPASDGGGQGL